MCGPRLRKQMSLRRLRKTTRKSNSRRLRGGNTEQQLRQRLDIVTDQRDVARDAANDWQAKFNEWFARATRAEQKLARAEQALAVVDDLSYRLFLDSGSIAK